MTSNEQYFIKKLLEVESEGLPSKTKNRIFLAFDSNKIDFKNLQVCLDKINFLKKSL